MTIRRPKVDWGSTRSHRSQADQIESLHMFRQFSDMNGNQKIKAQGKSLDGNSRIRNTIGEYDAQPAVDHATIKRTVDSDPWFDE